uniref:Uncharacterized protein n=1 Tax=Oryza brachyantha TaxID=4533 RepID=J3L8B6_ORYBR
MKQSDFNHARNFCHFHLFLHHTSVCGIIFLVSPLNHVIAISNCALICQNWLSIQKQFPDFYSSIFISTKQQTLKQVQQGNTLLSMSSKPPSSSAISDGAGAAAAVSRQLEPATTSPLFSSAGRSSL